MPMFKRACVVLLLISACGILLLISASACSSSTTPTPTCQDRTATNFGGPLPCNFPPDCQLHNTGTLVLKNNAANLQPRDAIVNGADWGTIPWGSQISRDVVAGATYTVVFTATSNGVAVTAPAAEIVVQCSTTTLTTSFSVGGEVLQ